MKKNVKGKIESKISKSRKILFWFLIILFPLMILFGLCLFATMILFMVSTSYSFIGDMLFWIFLVSVLLNFIFSIVFLKRYDNDPFVIIVLIFSSVFLFFGAILFLFF